MNKEILKSKIGEIFGCDLRSLAAFRIGIASILIIDLLWRFTDLKAHYTDFGVLPRSLLLSAYPDPWVFSIHLIGGSVFIQALLFVAALVFALFLLVGYRTRMATLVSWFFLVSLLVRNPQVFFGGDQLLVLILFWGIFLPLGARYSVDSALYLESGNLPSRYLSWGTAAILFQVVIMYSYAGYVKSGADWKDGMAVYYVLGLDYFHTPFSKSLLEMPLSIIKMISHATLWWERYGSLFFFIPFFTVFFRMATVLLYMSMHLGFRLALELGIFPWVNCVALIPLIPAWFWDTFLRGFKAREIPIRIFYDDTHPFWRRVLFLMRSFFLRSKTQLISAQSNPELDTERNHQKSSIVVEREGYLYYGFQAVEVICRTSPLIWFLTPILRWKPLWNRGNALCEGLFQRHALSPPVIQQTIVVRPYSVGPKWLAHYMPLVILLYVFIINLSSISNSKFHLPTRLRRVGAVLKINQTWRMFSPNIYRFDGWFVIPGKLKDGRELDLLRRGAPVSWERPSRIYKELYGNQRRLKYMESLSRRRAASRRLPYAQYLCRDWNSRHRGDEQLQELEIYFMQERTLPDFKLPETKKIRVIRHECFRKPDSVKDKASQISKK